MTEKNHKREATEVHFPRQSLSLSRRKLVVTTVVAMLGAGTPFVSTFAQRAYPNKPLKFIVDSPPGGTTDLIARIAADELNRKFGISVIVENKPGAMGRIASEYVAKSPGDGYTLLICTNGSLFTTIFLERGSKFDPVKELTPVFNMGELPHILVIPDFVPAKDLAGFVAYGKSMPGQIFYGSAGNGSQRHIAISHLARLTGMQLVHVPYKGMGAALIDLLGGRLQVMSAGLGTVRPYLKGGELKALAIASKKRLAGLPDVPTAAEAGVPGWEMSPWFGVFAPKNTDSQIVRILNEKLQSVFDDTLVKQKLADIGMESVGGSVPSVTERVAADFKLYGQIIKDSGIQIE